MDEPTNHLDLFSKDVLLEALRSFTGTLVFVSHDRHFIDGLATRVVEVEDGRLASYHGDYEYYLAKKSGEEMLQSGRAEEKQPLTPDFPDVRAAALPKDVRLRSREEDKQRQREERQRQKRLSELEREIEVAEGRLAEIESAMADPAFFADHEKARQAGEEHTRMTKRIAELYAGWEDLH
jgi:ATP-binding cassette subfamily F protein 3